MDAVGHLLAERQQEPYPWAAGVVLALLLHGLVLGAILFSNLAHPIRYLPTRAVAVRLIQAGSVKGGAPAVRAPEPQPERPRIEKPPEEAPPPPTEKAKLLPAKKEEKKKPPPQPSVAPTSRKAPETHPASAPSATRGEGGPVGAGGNVGIGGATFDQPDFNYSYYIERMLVTIGTNWFKPAQTVPTSPVIRFQILRDGTISGADVERSSGLAFVDRAALRAVLASSPLPPLPTEFSGDHLGVHLIFE